MNPRQIRLFEKLDQLIHLGQTGRPDELAKKLGISKSDLVAFVKLMKQFQMPLVFDIRLQSYIYHSKPDYKTLLFSTMFSTNNFQSDHKGKQDHLAPIPFSYSDLRIV